MGMEGGGSGADSRWRGLLTGGESQGEVARKGVAQGQLYAAFVPDLPGCLATGDSVEETRKLIRVAIDFHLEGMRQDGFRFRSRTRWSRGLWWMRYDGEEGSIE